MVGVLVVGALLGSTDGGVLGLVVVSAKGALVVGTPEGACVVGLPVLGALLIGDVVGPPVVVSACSFVNELTTQIELPSVG